MSTIIERAKAEAERRWPAVNQPTFGPDDYMDMGTRSGFEQGATFAATITPEQIEDGARALHEGYTGNRHEWDDVSEAERFDFRNDARAAVRAMGFVIEGES